MATTGAYSDLSGKPTLGTAAAKDATSSVTSGSTDLIESGAVYTGLSVKANSADLGTAAAKNFTTSVTNGSGDLVTSGAVYSETQPIKEFIGKKLTAQTLSVGSTTLTFTDASITTDSTILIRASVYGIAPTAVTVSTGSVVLTFDAQESAVSVYIIVC